MNTLVSDAAGNWTREAVDSRWYAHPVADRVLKHVWKRSGAIRAGSARGLQVADIQLEQIFHGAVRDDGRALLQASEDGITYFAGAA